MANFDITTSLRHFGTGSHIGLGAIVRPDITVSANAVIGAGAVVIKDIPEGVTVFSVRVTVFERVNR